MSRTWPFFLERPQPQVGVLAQNKHAHTHTYIHTRAHLFETVHMYTPMHMHTYIHTFTLMHVCMHVYIRLHVHMHTRGMMARRAHTHSHFTLYTTTRDTWQRCVAVATSCKSPQYRCARLQRTATDTTKHCKERVVSHVWTSHDTYVWRSHVIVSLVNWHNSWRCIALQYAATHCNTLQRTATHCNALQHTATHCNTLQHIATHCNALQHTAMHYNTLQHAATHCNTLQHTQKEWSTQRTSKTLHRLLPILHRWCWKETLKEPLCTMKRALISYGKSPYVE